MINDRFGHERGSEAIRNIADILKKTFRSADIIARLGGDEFTILGADISPTSEEILKTRLEKNISCYNERGDSLYQLSLSLGMVRIDTASEVSIKEWLIKADDAMYKDKRNKQRLHFNRTSTA